ncbi:BlaI/MecI/CopY family transcriptional regulator, partial [Streptomyces sp. NPDC005728]|uniref:BlaI/MecI/CopY family transcriptional regulator n=1 Tax=Streptomyces sp. NPDC005728 TaxID=3157054 RepID=UPI0033DB6BBD
SVKKPVAKKTATKRTGTTLVDLIHRHLTEQSGPRSAAEVSEALGNAHPDRNIATTVVRTTLENLVAKSLAQRTKQGSSVYYTAAPASEPTAAPTDEARPETAG